MLLNQKFEICKLAKRLRVRLRNRSMRDAPEEQAAHRDMDHGLRDVDAGLVVAYQAAPSHHPAEGPLDDPAGRLHLEARLGIDPADDLDDEFEEGGLVHQL